MNEDQEKQKLWKTFFIILGVMLVGPLLVIGGQSVWNSIQQRFAQSAVQPNSQSTISSSNSNTDQLANTNSLNNPEPVNVTNEITQTAAVNLIEQWLEAKKQIFAPPYNKSLGERLLTGSVYRKFITKIDDVESCLANTSNEDNCLSSVDWLIRNRAYWRYGVQRIENVSKFVVSGNNATIKVVVTEERKLYNRKGDIDRTVSGRFTSTTSYDLVYARGELKISNYK